MSEVIKMVLILLLLIDYQNSTLTFLELFFNVSGYYKILSMKIMKVNDL